jgi:hypothetical protein
MEQEELRTKIRICQVAKGRINLHVSNWEFTMNRQSMQSAPAMGTFNAFFVAYTRTESSCTLENGVFALTLVRRHVTTSPQVNASPWVASIKTTLDPPLSETILFLKKRPENVKVVLQMMKSRNGLRRKMFDIKIVARRTSCFATAYILKTINGHVTLQYGHRVMRPGRSSSPL